MNDDRLVIPFDELGADDVARVGGKEEKMRYADSGDAPTVLIETTPEERRILGLADDEALTLARWAVTIERHYGKPMDMEWASDGETGALFIVEARPETVHSRRAAGMLETYHMIEMGKELASGYAIGDAIATGKACRLEGAERPSGLRTDSTKAIAPGARCCVLRERHPVSVTRAMRASRQAQNRRQPTAVGDKCNAYPTNP